MITAAFLINYFNPDSVNPNKENLIANDYRNTIEDNLIIMSDSSGIIESPSKEKVVSGNESIPKQLNKLSKINSDKGIVIIPEYTIERIERLSGAFKQGKLYVTVDENSSDESQQLLCEYLVKQYDEFLNIVICIYADNSAGINLAKGIDESLSVGDKKILVSYVYL